MNKSDTTPRRDFITKVVGATAAFSLSSVITPLSAQTGSTVVPQIFNDAEKWFAQLKGKHKMVFDWPREKDGAALSWALTLMDTYNDMGIPDKDLSIVIILRYATVPLAIADPLWSKYGFGNASTSKIPTQKNLPCGIFMQNVQPKMMIVSNFFKNVEEWFACATMHSQVVPNH